MADWIKLENQTDLENIPFSTIDDGNYQCISQKVFIQFSALKKIKANKHSIKLTIIESRNPNVFFQNGKRTIYRPITYDVNAGSNLKPLAVVFKSDLDLPTLKIFPFLVEYYFRPDVPPARYKYEGDYQSYAID